MQLGKGTLIGSPLYYPDGELLGFRNTSAGLYNVYANIETEKTLRLGNFYFSLMGGRKYIFCESVSLFVRDIIAEGRFHRFSTMDTMRMRDMIDIGYIHETNYEDALALIDLSEKYKGDIEELGIGDTPVYQVTEDGHDMVIAEKKSGDPLPPSTVGEQIGGLIPGRIPVT